METHGLNNLIELLNHPYLVRNRLAEALYPDDHNANAVHTRLKSRTIGRHRFQEAEVKELLRLLNGLSKKFDRLAENMQPLHAKPLNLKTANNFLEHPYLHAKPLIEQAIGNKNYFSFYDQLRGKSPLSEDWLNIVIEELRRFSGQILDHCEKTRQEANRYPYSYGKGGPSHLG